MIEKKVYMITEKGKTIPKVWLYKDRCVYIVKDVKEKDKTHYIYEEAETDYYKRCKKF